MINNKVLLIFIFFIGIHCGYAQQNNELTNSTIAINPTNKTALLDGRCGNDEWEVATKIELAAGASIYLMYDKDYFYFCACGKAEDYTILDLYIEHPQTKQLHKFHLSAQMGEAIFIDNEWKPVSGKWELKDYAGFWVPYNGLADPEKRIDPKFVKGTHRQMQISRKKFEGTTWNMMFGVGGILHEGKGEQFFYPENAVANDISTWQKFLFPK